uniref:UL14-like protein n=1 Tax=Anatid alphaherpesvirus 2 TaxID=3080522 RepID=A0AAU0K7C5_9ALPH
MFSLKALDRKRRQELAECRVRENVYREMVLDMLAEGVDTDGPEFVDAFTSARNAHRDYKAKLASKMRVEATERKALAIKNRIEEQTARKAIVDAYRRYLDPRLKSGLDDSEDDILEKEGLLEEAADSCACPADGGYTDGEWLDEEDEALLTKWLVLRAERPPVAAAQVARGALTEDSNGSPTAGMTTITRQSRPSATSAAARGDLGGSAAGRRGREMGTRPDHQTSTSAAAHRRPDVRRVTRGDRQDDGDRTDDRK